jgi:hypothetical protein
MYILLSSYNVVYGCDIYIYMQCSNWEKLSRGAQSNDLKTAFHVRNYLTQTRGGLRPSSPSTNFKYIFNTTFQLNKYLNSKYNIF